MYAEVWKEGERLHLLMSLLVVTRWVQQGSLRTHYPQKRTFFPMNLSYSKNFFPPRSPTSCFLSGPINHTIGLYALTQTSHWQRVWNLHGWLNPATIHPLGPEERAISPMNMIPQYWCVTGKNGIGITVMYTPNNVCPGHKWYVISTQSWAWLRSFTKFIIW